MLANDNEFIVYGGLVDDTDSIDPKPPANYYVARYLHSSEQTSLAQPQWKTMALERGTRYIADGAYVNVPSENKAFIFGGSRVCLRGFPQLHRLPVIGRQLGRNSRMGKYRR